MGREKTQFKKGTSGNPRGRYKVAPEVLAARKLTLEELSRILNKQLFMTTVELNEICNNFDSAAIEVLIARIIMIAIKTGDPLRLNFLIERLIGKVPQVMEAKIKYVESLSPTQLKDAIKKDPLLLKAV